MVPLLTKLACRTFAVLLLITGVAVGIHTGTMEDEPAAPRQLAQDDMRATDAHQQGTRDWHRDYTQLAADEDAEDKAESIAQVASDQAKALDETFEKAKADEKEKKDKDKEKPDPGPIPSDCDEYSGNQAVGCARLLKKGFGLDQMPCLDKLWDHESGWNEKASNGGSGAYGIPQALPGSKMATAGDDWESNPATQVDWGLGYIQGRYDDPCGAWEFWQANNSY